MAPFQLRVRTLYPRTQPVPSTPLSIRLGPSPPSDVHPGEVRTQHVGSTRRPLSPELRTPPPPHRTPGTQRAGLTSRAKCISTRSGASSSSYSDTASCPAGHTAALLAVTSMSKSAAVSLTGPSPLSASAGARPPTGLTNSVPYALPPIHCVRIHTTCRTTAPKDRSHAPSTCLSPPPSHRRRHRSMASPPRG